MSHGWFILNSCWNVKGIPLHKVRAWKGGSNSIPVYASSCWIYTCTLFSRTLGEVIITFFEYISRNIATRYLSVIFTGLNLISEPGLISSSFLRLDICIGRILLSILIHLAGVNGGRSLTMHIVLLESFNSICRSLCILSYRFELVSYILGLPDSKVVFTSIYGFLFNNRGLCKISVSLWALFLGLCVNIKLHFDISYRCWLISFLLYNGLIFCIVVVYLIKWWVVIKVSLLNGFVLSKHLLRALNSEILLHLLWLLLVQLVEINFIHSITVAI